MADPSSNEATGDKTLTSFYSYYLWNRLVSIFSSHQSHFLGKISKIYLRTFRTASHRRRPHLPLPLPSNSLDSSMVVTEESRAFDVLEDILQNILLNLHNIEKNLHFWQSKAAGSKAQKVYFMIFERGPRAFLDGSFLFMREFVREGSALQHLCHSVSSQISEKITILSSLRYALASFLTQVYMEIDRMGEELVKDPERSLLPLLVVIDGLFSKLAISIGHLNATPQGGHSVEGAHSVPLLFQKLLKANQEVSQWTDCEISDAINLVYQNLLKLDSYLSIVVAKQQKPRKITQYWIRYTCGAVGLSVCSMWLLRHSSLMGSSDIDNWICEARDSTVSFLKDHVEQPLLSIRDELFETFRKRHKGVMELDEVQLTAKSLHRMLLTFSEQTKRQKFPENISDQEMLEIVMARYEKELVHPIQNLLGGELGRALLIQIQKLKLDIETAMLELNQILRANEINFAILAALPAFFLSLLLLMLVRAWFKKDTRAEGRGRIARIQRRLLIVEIERRIMQYQTCVDQGLEQDAKCMYGLMLYSLDRLYRAVERHAQATGEWLYLRQDIIDVGKPGIRTAYKITTISRMERVYDCLLPSTKRP